jgi:non-canonical (house-cleaning) NTP pyrophosphatase
MIKIALASASQIKIDALTQCLKSLSLPYEIIPVKITMENQCAQPFNMKGGQLACADRIEWMFSNVPEIYDYDYIVAIENYICCTEKEDRCCIIIDNVSERWGYITHSSGITLPDESLLTLLMSPEYAHLDAGGRPSGKGATETYGNLYHQANPLVPADNWMSHTANIDRAAFITKYLIQLFDGKILPDLEFVRSLATLNLDDIFLDPMLATQLIKYIARKYVNKVDYVIGLSTGYLIAVPLALECRAGFVRSGLTVSPGRVLIIDNILEKSMEDAILLAQKAGHTVIDAIAITGDVHLLPNYPIRILRPEISS